MNPTSYVEIGDTAEFSKTITDADIALFCAVSGDFDPIHIDDEHARKTKFGRRIAHGVLSLSLMSAVSSMISKRAVDRGNPGVSISMGYDHIRFLKPVFVGDTIKARYTVEDIDLLKSRTRSKVEVRNQRGDVVAVAEHLMKWLPPEPSAQMPVSQAT